MFTREQFIAQLSGMDLDSLRALIKAEAGAELTAMTAEGALEEAWNVYQTHVAKKAAAQPEQERKADPRTAEVLQSVREVAQEVSGARPVAAPPTAPSAGNVGEYEVKARRPAGTAFRKFGIAFPGGNKWVAVSLSPEQAQELVGHPILKIRVKG